MPQHPQRLRLEERIQRMAIAAQHCADLADHQGLTSTSEILTGMWVELLALDSQLSVNRQPKLWSVDPGGLTGSRPGEAY